MKERRKIFRGDTNRGDFLKQLGGFTISRLFQEVIWAATRQGEYHPASLLFSMKRW